MHILMMLIWYVHMMICIYITVHSFASATSCNKNSRTANNYLSNYALFLKNYRINLKNKICNHLETNKRDSPSSLHESTKIISNHILQQIGKNHSWWMEFFRCFIFPEAFFDISNMLNIELLHIRNQTETFSSYFWIG